MTITTAGTAVNLAPTVTKTFFKHYYKKAKRSLKGRSGKGGNGSPTHNRHNALDEFMFDEAFHIVKAFIEIGTSDTVEAIQDFTDAPAPPIPWATTLPVMIPMESCDKAAKLIIDHLGPEDLQKLVGGEKWWQLRSMPGVQAEWIAMSNDWKKDEVYGEEGSAGRCPVREQQGGRCQRRPESIGQAAETSEEQTTRARALRDSGYASKDRVGAQAPFAVVQAPTA